MGVILIFVVVCSAAVCPITCASQITLSGNLEVLTATQRKAVNHYIAKHEVPTGEVRILAQRNEISVRSSKVLAELFPKYKLVAIPWAYEVSPEALRKYSIPGGLSDVLALDSNAIRQYVLHSTGNQEEYGQFLSAMKVRIVNDEDAARVARAIAEIRGGGISSRNVRHGGSEWYLGYQEFPFRAISGSEEIREAYYFHARTDASGVVLGGRLESEILERGKIPSTGN